MSEDYAIFDVDVTTEDVPDSALIGKGIRVAIGGSSFDVSVGGYLKCLLHVNGTS